MSSASEPKTCQQIIRCPTTYIVTPESTGSNQKVRISESGTKFGFLTECSNLPGTLPYNPCNEAVSCCYNQDARVKYTPLDQDGLCPIVCPRWTSQTTTESKTYWEYSNTPMSTDCPEFSHSKDPSDYLNNSGSPGNQCTGWDDQVVFTLNGQSVTEKCNGVPACDYADFDRVECVQLNYNSTIEEVDKGKLNTYCASLTNDGVVEGNPELSSVFDSARVSDYIELDSTKQTELGRNLCTLSNIGISNLYVVLGERSLQLTDPQEIVGSHAHVFDKMTTFDNLESNQNFVDKVQAVNNVVPEIFGAWDLDIETRGNGNTAKNNYYIITTDLQACNGFYNSIGIDTDAIFTGNQETELVEFEFVNTVGAIYKTGSCPTDTFYKLTNSNNSCIDVVGGAISPPNQYCCIKDYTTQNDYLVKASPSDAKTCIPPFVSTPTNICTDPEVYRNNLSITDQTTNGGYMCGPEPASATSNILNDQGSNSLINMYPGYDYQYIDYANTEHTYYNGNHDLHG